MNHGFQSISKLSEIAKCTSVFLSAPEIMQYLLLHLLHLADPVVDFAHKLLSTWQRLISSAWRIALLSSMGLWGINFIFPQSVIYTEIRNLKLLSSPSFELVISQELAQSASASFKKGAVKEVQFGLRREEFKTNLASISHSRIAHRVPRI